MRASRMMVPVLTGLLLSGLSACSDDSSSSDDTSMDDDGLTDDDDLDDDDLTDDDDLDDDDVTDDDDLDDDDVTDDDDLDDDDVTDDDDLDDDDVTDDDDLDDDGTDAGVPEGGVEPTEGGMPDGDAGDGGDTEGDGGDDSGPAPCESSPADPDNGDYADCAGVADGEICELSCDDNYVANGDATCMDGVWSDQSCVRLGTLSAEISNAATGEAIDDAIVYVSGLYDPDSDDCEDSLYCSTSSSDGSVDFSDFPEGSQEIVIVKDGFEEIALSVSVLPGEDRSVNLNALPEGFLQGNLVVLLTWEVGGDLDLVLGVPTDDGLQCVYYDEDARGSLTEVPWAQLDHDSKGSTAKGPETIRIALNEDETGPFYTGDYSAVVSTGARTLTATRPEVRLIRGTSSGGAIVETFELPEDAVDGATEWHVFDLESDGTALPAGVTQVNDDKTTSDLPCVSEL